MQTSKNLSWVVISLIAGTLAAFVSLHILGAYRAKAASNIFCVNTSGSGCDASICGGGCYASLQAAVDAANPGNEIRVAGGTYLLNNTVAKITKEIRIFGGYSTDLTINDPDLYKTILDANWSGSVISITSAGEVSLMSLILAHGDGVGNCGSCCGCGGGIFVEDSSLRLIHSTITDCVGSRSGRGFGGGIYAQESNLDIRDSHILSNTGGSHPLYGSEGGGLYAVSISGGNSLSLVNNKFEDNIADNLSAGQGGGIMVHYLASANILSNTIRQNRSSSSGSTSGFGGGLYISSSSNVLVEGNLIENNLANPSGSGPLGYGGGVYVYNSDAHLSRNFIISNTAALGGGAFIRSQKPVTLSNNLIVENDPQGGGVQVTEYYSSNGTSRALLVNNTIANNGAPGITAQYYCAITLTNNIIAGHSIGINTPSPYSGTISANRNLFWNTSDPITGTEGIRQDPKLTTEYRLQAGSPAIDAGITIPWLLIDLEGKPRLIGWYDLGAYEAFWNYFLPLVLRMTP